MNESVVDQRPSRGHWQLLLMVLIFAAPLVAGWFYFFNPDLLPSSRSNHGTLIMPPIPATDLALHDEQGQALDWSGYEGMWTYVKLAPAYCDEACMTDLVQLRQIWKAQGANRDKVERILVMQSNAAGELQQPDLTGLEGTRAAQIDSADIGSLLARLSLQQTDVTNTMLVIDPRLDLMMVYDTSTHTSKQILEDLEKLLKASQNWAQGGRYGHK